MTSALSEAETKNQIVEFQDAPSLGGTLFIHSTWSPCLPGRLPDGDDAILCTVLACDGESCWEGSLKRCDLSGALGESWAKESNLQLLLNALTQSGSDALAVGTHGQVDPFGRAKTPCGRSEAHWTSTEQADGRLQLSIRFIYEEGPIVAVSGAHFPRSNLGTGLSRFFQLAHSAQNAANSCAAEAKAECLKLDAEEEELRRELEALPKKAEEEHARLLEEMVTALNNQKRRCRKLWQADFHLGATDATAADLDAETLHLVEAPATLSLEEATLSCLDREEQELSILDSSDEQDEGNGFDLSAPSLVFATQPGQPSAPADPVGEGDDFTFTIPLTLGMGDFGIPSFKASAKRSLSATNLPAASSLRRRLEK